MQASPPASPPSSLDLWVKKDEVYPTRASSLAIRWSSRTSEDRYFGTARSGSPKTSITTKTVNMVQSQAENIFGDPENLGGVGQRVYLIIFAFSQTMELHSLPVDCYIGGHI